MRIVSLLPAATEIVAGLIEHPLDLVGITHECDYPAWVQDRPRVVGPFENRIGEMSPAEVDERVTQAAQAGQSLYVIDDAKMEELRPDVVVTQGLCEVCAVGQDEVARALARLPQPPQVVSLSPSCLVDVLDDIVRVGRALGREDAALAWRDRLGARLDWIGTLPRIEPAPNVLVLEWSDPCWSAGHWVPEMIDLAGGIPCAGAPGKPSARLDLAELSTHPPDFVLLACCGYDTARNAREWETIRKQQGVADWPAVRHGQVYAVDANSYFSRPSPRLVVGIEIILAILRGMPTPAGAVERLTP